MSIASIVIACISLVFNGLLLIYSKSKEKNIKRDIENLKAENEKLTHISKVQFDYEIQTYQRLMEISQQVLDEVNQLSNDNIAYLLRSDNTNRLREYEEQTERLGNSLHVFAQEHCRSAIFITEENAFLFLKFHAINIKIYENFCSLIKHDFNITNEFKDTNNNYHKMLTDQLDKIRRELRKHLSLMKIAR